MIFDTLNKYLFYDPILGKIFDYLCTYDKEVLTNRMAVKLYICTDAIPQPFYQVVKDRVTEQGKYIGLMSSCTVYILFMIGSVIGFVMVNQNHVVCSHMDSELIQSVFQKNYPTLIWD